MFKRFIYKEGDKIGKCTFLREPEYKRPRVAIFRCECGKEFKCGMSNVKYHGQCCGCKRRVSLNPRKPSIPRNCIYDRKTHDGKRVPEYNSWCSMKARCYSVNNPKYYRYGKRGIKVCDRWVNSFDNFYADMGKKPNSRLTVERKNNDKDYTPENCIWGTSKEQARNRSTNTLLTYNGVTKCIAEWAEELSISAASIYGRVYKLKWPIEKCLTTKVRKINNIKRMGPKPKGLHLDKSY